MRAVGGRPKKGGFFEISGVSTDSRTVKEGDLFVAISGPNFDGHDYLTDAFAHGAAGAIVSRNVEGLPHADRCIRVADTRRALGDLAAHVVRQWGGKVIAITGSNGKTTTKEMTHAALTGSFRAVKSPRSFNNEIGVPHTLFSLRPEDDIAVLEMGTSGHGEIRRLAHIAGPVVGAVTNIGEAHLEGLRSLKGVANAKAELLDELPAHGTAVMNADDPMTPWLRKWCDCEVVTFGESDAADLRATAIRSDGWTTRFTVRGIPCALPVPGRHNVHNALAALACCEAVGADLRDAAGRLEGLTPPEMRMARREAGGVTIINDAYNANIRSMEAAIGVLNAMPVRGRRAMIAGDMLELGMRAPRLHRRLGDAIANARVDVLVTVGDWAWRAGETARRAGHDLDVIHCDAAEEAGETLAERLAPGDAVLVKGSRGMQLEKAVERLCDLLGGADGGAVSVDPLGRAV